MDNDILIGDVGADQFRLSKGVDVIQDFSFVQGDVVGIVTGQAFSITQSGADIVIIREGLGNTTLLNVSLQAFQAANPIVLL